MTMTTPTETPRTDASSPEFVFYLHGWYDNFLSGRRYYISGNGQVRRFMDEGMLESYGREFPYIEKETLRFGFYPDFPDHLLGQLIYK